MTVFTQSIAALYLGGAILLVGSCNVFDARSSDLKCSVPADCNADRVCDEGFCVVRADLLPDADPSLPDSDPSLPDSDPSLPDAAADATTGPSADAGPCNSIGLIDDFSDGLAAPLWTETDTPDVTIVEAGGVLTIANTILPASPVSVSYASVTRNYDMTGSSFAIELPTMVDTASKADVDLRVGSAAASQVQIRQKTGNLTATLFDGGMTVMGTTAYSASAHRWWRITESGGSVLAQTSPDGATWSTLGMAPTPTFLNAVGVDLVFRAFTTGVVPGAVVYDNANIGVDCSP